jgi:hypothetical protein
MYACVGWNNSSWFHIRSDSCALSPTLTYTHTLSHTHLQFQTNAHEIATSALQNAQTQFQAIQTLSALYTVHMQLQQLQQQQQPTLFEISNRSDASSSSSSSSSLGLVRLSDFEAAAATTRPMAAASWLAYAPVVASYAQRVAWDKYVGSAPTTTTTNIPVAAALPLLEMSPLDLTLLHVDLLQHFPVNESAAYTIQTGTCSLSQQQQQPTNGVGVKEPGPTIVDSSNSNMDQEQLSNTTTTTLTSVFLEPVMSSLEETTNAVVVGIVAATIPWASYFTNVGVKPHCVCVGIWTLCV